MLGFRHSFTEQERLHGNVCRRAGDVNGLDSGTFIFPWASFRNQLLYTLKLLQCFGLQCSHHVHGNGKKKTVTTFFFHLTPTLNTTTAMYVEVFNICVGKFRQRELRTRKLSYCLQSLSLLEYRQRCMDNIKTNLKSRTMLDASVQGLKAVCDKDYINLYERSWNVSP